MWLINNSVIVSGEQQTFKAYEFWFIHNGILQHKRVLSKLYHKAPSCIASNSLISVQEGQNSRLKSYVWYQDCDMCNRLSIGKCKSFEGYGFSYPLGTISNKLYICIGSLVHNWTKYEVGFDLKGLWIKCC